MNGKSMISLLRAEKGKTMGKIEKTIYKCDRCGKEIAGENVRTRGNFKYLRVFKWWFPLLNVYRMTYLCKECADDYGKWFRGGKKDDE